MKYLIAAAVAAVSIGVIMMMTTQHKSSVPMPTPVTGKVHRVDVVEAAAGRVVVGSPHFVATRDGEAYLFSTALNPAMYLDHPEKYPDVEEHAQLAAHK